MQIGEEMKYKVWISNCCGAPMEHDDFVDKCGYCGKTVDTTM